MEEGKQPYVFISYSSKNLTEANSLRKLLEIEKISCWMAPNDIPAGSEYADVIVRALKECACLVLVLTQEAQKSKWVAKEVERAINYDKLILSAQLEELELSGRFEFYVGDRQIVRVGKLTTADEGFRRIVDGIRGVTGAKAPAVQPRREENPFQEGKVFVPRDWRTAFLGTSAYGETIGQAMAGRLTMTVPALAKTDKGYVVPEFICRKDGRGDKGEPICAAEWGPDGPVELYCVDSEGRETPWEQETDVDPENYEKFGTKALYLIREDIFGNKSFYRIYAADEAALRLHREFRKGDRVVVWGGYFKVGRINWFDIHTILHLGEDRGPERKE